MDKYTPNMAGTWFTDNETGEVIPKKNLIITNTQYLKIGYLTNFGKVIAIHDNASFKTADGFSHNVREVDVCLV